MDIELSQLRSASLDANGYVREDAVRRLAKRKGGEELPCLLLRLNDWVPQVRDVAREAVLARVVPGYAHDFIRQFALLARLRQWRRVDHRPVVDAIITLLATTPSVRADLLATLNHQWRDNRRMAFEVLARGELADDFIRAALASRDPALRLRATLMALPRASAGDLHARLLDGRAAIRDLARFHYRKLVPDFDFARFYREARFLPGVEETGSAADASFLLPFLEHPRPRKRRAAVRALLRLGGEEYVPQVLPLLRDASVSVSRQAMLSLREYVSSLTAAEVWTFAQSLTDHVHLHVLALIAAMPKWESLPYLLRARAHDLLARWNQRFNRSSLQPTAAQLADAQAAFAMVEKELEPKLAEAIGFALRTGIGTPASGRLIWSDPVKRR